MRKAYQREFNKRIRALNKNIANDELWRGRFVFLQRDAYWWKFSDNSGGELIVFVRGYDKKTGYYKDYRLEFAPWLKTVNWHLSIDIANDNLWRGRFIFLQRDAHWWKFSDNSGGELIVFVRGYDKKTGYYKDYRLEFAPWLKSVNWHLSMDIANEFITEAAEVWSENPRPSINTAEDWTSAKVNVEKLMAKDWNFHVAYKYWEDGKNIW